MTPEQSFLAAIIAAPDDDTPRIQFADWLDEYRGKCGALRAEFICVQIERAKLPAKDVESSSETVDGHFSQTTFRLKCGGGHCMLLLNDAIHTKDCRWEMLRRREKELLDSHSRYWLEGIDGSGILVPKANFRRGFVASITCTAAQFREHGEAILQAQPIEKLTLDNFFRLEELAGLPLLAMRNSSVKDISLWPYLAQRYHRDWLAQHLPGISIRLRGEPAS